MTSLQLYSYNRHHWSTSDVGGEAVKMESNFYIFRGVKSYNSGKSDELFKIGYRKRSSTDDIIYVPFDEVGKRTVV